DVIAPDDEDVRLRLGLCPRRRCAGNDQAQQEQSNPQRWRRGQGFHAVQNGRQPVLKSGKWVETSWKCARSLSNPAVRKRHLCVATPWCRGVLVLKRGELPGVQGDFALKIAGSSAVRNSAAVNVLSKQALVLSLTSCTTMRLLSSRCSSAGSSRFAPLPFTRHFAVSCVLPLSRTLVIPAALPVGSLYLKPVSPSARHFTASPGTA